MSTSKTRLLFLMQLFSLLILLQAAVMADASQVISIGSTLSTSSNQLSYWLSPSGNFSFGFYPDPTGQQQHTIGIWLARTCNKTLLWSLPPYTPSTTNSSILFDHDGLFLLNGSDRKPLLPENIPSLTFSYACMHDNGNFAIYNNNSHVLWQSFDYPTDTILANQTLKSGDSLLSSGPGRYKLLMQEDGILRIYDLSLKNYNTYLADVSSAGRNSVSLNLNSNGSLYLADYWNDNDAVFERLNECARAIENRVYRATMDGDGRFRLYGEIECSLSEEKANVLWQSSDLTGFDSSDSNSGLWTLLVFFFILDVAFTGLLCDVCLAHRRCCRGEISGETKTAVYERIPNKDLY